MITSSTSLDVFVSEYEESGMVLAPFKTKAGDKFIVRAWDPEEFDANGAPVGRTIVASFGKSLSELGSRPSNLAKAKEKADELYELLHDAKSARAYQVCEVLVTQDDIDDGWFDQEDLNHVFRSICLTGTATGEFTVPGRENATAAGETGKSGKPSKKRV